MSWKKFEMEDWDFVIGKGNKKWIRLKQNGNWNVFIKKICRSLNEKNFLSSHHHQHRHRQLLKSADFDIVKDKKFLKCIYRVYVEYEKKKFNDKSIKFKESYVQEKKEEEKLRLWWACKAVFQLRESDWVELRMKMEGMCVCMKR